MNRDLARQLATVLAFLATVAVNAAAVAIPLGGMTTAQISDMFPVPIVPANYVFSIWSAIYLLLLGFTIWQALPSRREDPVLRRLGLLPALTGVLNTAWVLLWQYQAFVATVPVMLALLGTLSVIWLRIREPRAASAGPAPAAQGWLVALPFSVYLGWITVATVANVTQMLYHAGSRGVLVAPEVWGVAILLVALAIATVMIVRGRDIAFGVVIAWAYGGIAAKQAALELVPTVAIAGVVWVLLLVVLVAARPALQGARQEAPGGA
jgi:hypothetical protein